MPISALVHFFLKSGSVPGPSRFHTRSCKLVILFGGSWELITPQFSKLLSAWPWFVGVVGYDWVISTWWCFTLTLDL